MQETLAEAPFFDPPIDKFNNLDGQRAQASYGLIITGQVQIDIDVRSSLQHQDESMGDRAHLSSLHSRRRGPPLRYSLLPHASKPEKNEHRSHNQEEHHALYNLHTQVACTKLAQETDQRICPPYSPPRSQSPSAVNGSTSLPSNLFSEHPKL
jgi:hypothetical protein